MTFPVQKSFGDFIRERHGRNWVYAARARSTPRILAQYQKYNPETGEHEPPVVITPKQQRKLKTDYKREWGEEYNPAAWKALCALRYIKMELETAGSTQAMKACAQSHVQLTAAIEALTT